MLCCRGHDERATTLNSSGYKGPNREMGSTFSLRSTLVRPVTLVSRAVGCKDMHTWLGQLPSLTPQPVRGCERHDCLLGRVLNLCKK